MKKQNQIGPKCWAPDRRFYDLDGDPLTGFRVIFHGRVNNDGLTVIPYTTAKQRAGTPGWYRVFCLSITYDRWIATNGMSTYVVELVPRKSRK